MTEHYSCYIDYDNEKKQYFGEVRGRYDGGAILWTKTEVQDRTAVRAGCSGLLPPDRF